MKIFFNRLIFNNLLIFLFLATLFSINVIVVHAQIQSVEVNSSQLGFRVPTLAGVLTFFIRFFFVLGGIMALLYLLLGAFAWITSGGDKEAVTAAREKITNAIIGVILIVAVLAVIVTLEQIVFQKRICFGISCSATIPGLVKNCTPSPDNPTKCCSSGYAGYIPSIGATVDGTGKIWTYQNPPAPRNNVFTKQCCYIFNNTYFSVLNPNDNSFCSSMTGGQTFNQ